MGRPPKGINGADDGKASGRDPAAGSSSQARRPQPIQPRPEHVIANELPLHPSLRSNNAEAGPSHTHHPVENGVDIGGDTIMRDVAEGLVQEQRRSLRGRAARSGLATDRAEAVAGGSEMSIIAGVNASGKGVKIGGAGKIGTGPGGVQRKKKKGDLEAVSRHQAGWTLADVPAQPGLLLSMSRCRPIPLLRWLSTVLPLHVPRAALASRRTPAGRDVVLQEVQG